MPRSSSLFLIFWKKVGVQMTIAYVAEDNVVDPARVQCFLIESQEALEFFIWHGHIGPDLFLFVPNDALVHRNRQCVTKRPHLFTILVRRRKPGPLNIRTVFLKKTVPLLEQ